MKKRELRLPTIIGLLVVLAGLGTGLFGLRNPLRWSLSASGEEAPGEVKMSNVADSSFVVSWVTGKAVAGFVQYGESGKGLDLAVSDDRDQERGDVGSYYTHYVTLSGLKEGTRYSFKIGKDEKSYEVTTAQKLERTPMADVAYGLVTTEEGSPADGMIVYVQLPGGELASALTKSSGAWVIPLATIRAEGKENYVAYDKEQTELEISVQGGNLGTSLVTVKTAGDSPVPTIVLGKNYDFAADETGVSENESSGSAELFSRFSGEALAPGNLAGETTLEVLTPRNDEGINTQRPQIIGRAPAGVEVSIEIHSSHVIVGKVTTGEDGTFSYSVPTSLTPGEHTVTISAMIDGVLKQITKSFTVYAQGESNLPAFEATPSATLVPSPTTTTVPTPTSSPSVSPSPTPTSVAQPTIGPTVMPEPPAELPTSGNVWPTALILVLGLGLLASGGLLLAK
ncbi:fibronectin type III domain-containing protein [Candidatus Amesbacteria bacterium]|nr:fibronectin type III domain-containing protein [Candidatus Amesbacteria bacterium]MBI2587377.1 fibronectin type III domain-containing protein [Candidatus Amesbacteria bacterium]